MRGDPATMIARAYARRLGASFLLLLGALCFFVGSIMVMLFGGITWPNCIFMAAAVCFLLGSLINFLEACGG